jgi:hypothetical protein
MVYFPLPGPAEREKLWQQAFKGIEVLDEKDHPASFKGVAEQHKVAGGAIINVLRYRMLLHLQQQQVVSVSNITKGLQRELAKEVKTI